MADTKRDKRVIAEDRQTHTGGMTRQNVAPPDKSTRKGAKRDEPVRSYYDVPMLKPPVWKWEIASYFFLGGLSSGAYLLARMAAHFGGKKYRDVTEAGTAIAAAAFVPCAPLLIHDLGDPKRFLYMLRVFKPKSPMNLGSWVLTGYGAVVTLGAINQWRNNIPQGRKLSKELPSGVIDGAVEAVLDGAGLPLALLLAGYTGVLLTTTSTPLWTRKIWLDALFSASAVANGAEAINLMREVQSPDASEQPAHAPMRKLVTAAKVTEAVALAGYLHEAGKLAEPITKGKYAAHLWGGAVSTGLVLSTICDLVPVKNPNTKRALRIAGAVAGLAGGFALRWAITLGGHPSGSDPAAARKASQSEIEA